MENEASKTRSLNMAFLIDSESLRGLEKLLNEVNHEVEYKVKFSDGSTVKYSAIEEIISQPNSDRRLITSIVTSVEELPGRSVFITMRGNPEPSVEYTISGPQRNVIYFADKLDDWIASCRQWYSAFFSSNLGVMAGIAAVVLPFLLADRVARAFTAINRSTRWPYLATLAVISVAEYFTYKLFPQATFAIGHGARRSELFNALRFGVLGAFAVSLIAGLIANWVFSYF